MSCWLRAAVLSYAVSRRSLIAQRWAEHEEHYVCDTFTLLRQTRAEYEPFLPWSFSGGLACRYTLGREAAEQPKSLPTRISAALHSSRSEFSNNGTPLAIGRALRARRGSRGSPLAIGRALRARRGSRGLWLYVWCCSSARCHARDASRRETGPPRRYRRDAATRHATTQASRSTAPRTSAQKKRRPCRTACPSRRRRAAATR